MGVCIFRHHVNVRGSVCGDGGRFVCVYVCVCESVCVCVEREKEREREDEREREGCSGETE